MQITGYRLDGSDANAETRLPPTPEEAGRILLRVHQVRDSLLHTPGDNRWLRFFYLVCFLLGGFGLSIIWLDKLDRPGMEYLMVIGLYCALCVYIDERLIKPRTRTFARIPITLTSSCFHWNEGMEIGRVYYRDIQFWDKFVYPPKELESGATIGEQVLILLEDVKGQRLCFHNISESDIDNLGEKIRSKSSIGQHDHVID